MIDEYRDATLGWIVAGESATAAMGGRSERKGEKRCIHNCQWAAA
jgi:hypothetical protein